MVILREMVLVKDNLKNYHSQKPKSKGENLKHLTRRREGHY